MAFVEFVQLALCGISSPAQRVQFSAASPAIPHRFRQSLARGVTTDNQLLVSVRSNIRDDANASTYRLTLHWIDLLPSVDLPVAQDRLSMAGRGHHGFSILRTNYGLSI
ncbi:hypothetical protein [Mycobacteroides abscessus]|uniref:hypothetical protein n=1 Tax=Mycobacteroides abscessus TaxID=36809 RepID=UPI000941CF35|nr:hypothetical protein [Mycobacteroides abscessus]